MVRSTVRLTGPDEDSVAALAHRFAQIRSELGVAADFPAEVLDAAQAAADAPQPSDGDLRDLPFVTIDPPGSTDLDQAMFLARSAGSDGGYHVDYAIADVPAFVPAGRPVDAEARRRGQTLYAPDQRTPLHPTVLSESAASLLEGEDRPAFVWRFDLSGTGDVTAVDLVRARVRNRHRLDYAGVQAVADAHPDAAPGKDPQDDVALQAVLLREIGELRMGLERNRGGASLPLPEQEVAARDGRYSVTLRPAVPAEDWNAQISLMTGMAAAELMLTGRAGLLRTLPGPPPEAVDRFRRQAGALGIPWAAGVAYGEFLRCLRRDDPKELALMHEAGALFRGAGYTPIDPSPGAALPAVTTHAAVAAPYAHVTAPLRRLVDRFGLVVSHALCQGRTVPDWALQALPSLPAAMAASDLLAGQVEHRCTDVVEAAVLAHRVGEQFDAVVVDTHKTGVKVQLLEPAVLASATGGAALGAAVRVRLDIADVDQGLVEFSVR
jgi:exoribonuclease R